MYLHSAPAFIRPASGECLFVSIRSRQCSAQTRQSEINTRIGLGTREEVRLRTPLRAIRRVRRGCYLMIVGRVRDRWRFPWIAGIPLECPSSRISHFTLLMFIGNTEVRVSFGGGQFRSIIHFGEPPQWYLLGYFGIPAVSRPYVIRLVVESVGLASPGNRVCE
jgi:hypothetical protein